MVLVFALPSDAVVQRFAAYASSQGLNVWHPKFLEDVGWSFNIDGGRRTLEICDRLARRRWLGEDLAGVWYQALPPLVAERSLDERDRRYVTAEFSASVRAFCHAAPCPVVGRLPHNSLFGSGLEWRVDLRHHGIPVPQDSIGGLSFLRASLQNVADECIWVTRLDGSPSLWLSDLLAMQTPGASPDVPSLPIATTVVERRETCVVIHVEEDTLTVELDAHGRFRTRSIRDKDPDAEDLARRLAQLTSARAGVTYLVREEGGWAVTSMSFEFPPWLVDVTKDWLFPRLLALFGGGSSGGAPTCPPT